MRTYEVNNYTVFLADRNLPGFHLSLIVLLFQYAEQACNGICLIEKKTWMSEWSGVKCGQTPLQARVPPLPIVMRVHPRGQHVVPSIRILVEKL